MSTVVQSRRYVAETAPTRLNWGCGAHVASGWINSDIKDDAGIDLVADIRQGLPLEDDSIDYAVSVHALPELPYPELAPTLAELRRALKPGGVLRLVLPDLDRAIDAYRSREAAYFTVPADEVRSLGGRFIVHALWLGYTRTLFTLDFTEELLVSAGFERVLACAYRRTGGPFGRIVELDNRPEESLYVEARKPQPTGGRQPLTYNSTVAGDALEIIAVTPDPGERVRAHFRVLEGEGVKVQIVGWVLGNALAATEVEVLADGAVAGRAPLAVERPDVAEAFPDDAAAGTAGFQLELMAKGRGESQLELYAVLEDDSREPLGRIVVKAERRGLLGALRRG
jgi:SAM-dependent methyltransferase